MASALTQCSAWTVATGIDVAILSLVLARCDPFGVDVPLNFEHGTKY